MGGNVRVLDKSGTEVAAEKIDLSRFSRDYVIAEMTKAFMKINDIFKKEHGYPLWKNKSVLTSGFAYNGSTSAMFNPEVDGAEFTKFKPLVGDIDITVPKTEHETLWNTLKKLQGKKITSNTKYIGDNRDSYTKRFTQINGIVELKNGKDIVQAQVDFEFTEYTDDEDHQPNVFAKFGHSSDFADISQNIKCVHHKFLMRAITSTISSRDDVLIATPKSSPEKPTMAKLKRPPSFLKFSVDHGLRVAYEQQYLPDGSPWMHKGKPVYKEIPTARSNYEQTLESFFTMMFDDEPSSNDIKKMWSFTGLLEIMGKYFDNKQIEKVFNRQMDLYYGRGAQGIEARNPEGDYMVKQPALEYFIKKFSFLKKKEKDLDKMKLTYYSNYRMK